MSDTAKRRERFERKLYARPKDRKTLLAFQNFLYEQGQYEYAKRVFAQSVAAGNDGRQMRLRMARTVLALYRIKLDEDVGEGEIPPGATFKLEVELLEIR